MTHKLKVQQIKDSAWRFGFAYRLLLINDNELMKGTVLINSNFHETSNLHLFP